MKHLEPGSARAQSFGPAAEQYDRLRPSYPDEALHWAVGEPAGPRTRLRVVDLGAGTGIVTRSLLGLGHVVVPVEPDPAMRERLAEATPEANPLAGSAEQIPLPDASVDAVVAGQAYHWFDRDPAHTEIARVLRAGGTFAAIWNMRDESVPWVAELSTITDDDTAGRGIREPGAAPDSFGPRFRPIARATFRHATEHTPDTLVGLIATRSYYLTATPDRQRELERRVRELCARHPDLAGRDRFPLPYRTEVYRAAREAAS